MSTPVFGSAPPPPPDGPWEPRFFTLPIHRVVEHQLRLALRGVESTLMHGPRGAGKTEAVRHYLGQIETQHLKAQLATGERAPTVLFYETSRAAGPKTVLTDVYAKIVGRPIGKRSKQDWSPTLYIDQITDRAIDDDLRLIVIDEAQMIDAANIDLLRQLPDAAARRGHSLRLFLVGNEGLVRTVAATGQAGERFTGDVPFPALSPGVVSPHLGEFHPGLAAVKAELGAKAWLRLERELFAAVRGSFRRLCRIIANAHEFTLARGAAPEAMSERDLRLAIGKLRDGDA